MNENSVNPITRIQGNSSSDLPPRGEVELSGRSNSRCKGERVGESVGNRLLLSVGESDGDLLGDGKDGEDELLGDGEAEGDGEDELLDDGEAEGDGEDELLGDVEDELLGDGEAEGDGEDELLGDGDGVGGKQSFVSLTSSIDQSDAHWPLI